MKLLPAFFIDKEQLEKREFLTNVPMFQGLKKRDFTYLIRILQERTYLKGETIFLEGDIGRALCIVVDGKVELTRKDETGKENILAEVRPGEIFGEMALLEEMPRTATAIAIEKTKTYLLYKNKLESLLYDYPRVGVVLVHYLARTLSSRLRAVIESHQQEK